MDHAGELEVVNNFAEILRAWYDAHGDCDSLDEAVGVGRRVARHVSPDNRNRPMYLANLCRSLRTRYDVAGDEADLRKSLEFGREASASGNDAGVLSTVGATLGMLYRHTGSTEYLDEAVDVGRRAVAATADGDPRKAVRLVNIASSLRARGTAADLAEAAGHLRGSAAWPTGAVEIRVLATIRLGDQSAEAGDAGLAMEGFGSAVRLLPLLAWRGLDHADKEERLAEQVGLTGASASWALNAGHPNQAVEPLDQGRSVLWTQLLDQRAEPAALAAVAPELHRRLREVWESLDRADPGAERP